MRSMLIFVVLVLLASVKIGSVSAQVTIEKKAELEMAAGFNRMAATLRYVHVENKPNSDLELTPEQMIGLTEIRARYAQAVNEYGKLLDAGVQSSQLLRDLSLKWARVQDNLFEDVLLKHQIEKVKNAVFENSLKKNEGNIVAAIASNYVDEVGLNMKQTEDFYDLNESVKDQIKKAKEEYERKVKEIIKKSEDQLDEILTDRQSKKLGSFRVKSKD